MSHVLALEPDLERGRTLRRFLRERVGAEAVVTQTADMAVATLAGRTPDLILTSALASPREELQLMAYLRQLGDAYNVPVLTIPPLASENEPPPRGRSWFGRRPALRRFPYDPDAVSGRIAEALEQSRSAPAPRPRRIAPVPVEPERLPAAADPAPFVRREPLHHRRAHRWTKSDLPWLWGVAAPWGGEIELVNISTTGLLVRAPRKFAPGSEIDLTLIGRETRLVVRARFVRSEVAAVQRLGVKYEAAATFGERLKVLADRPVAERASPGALADLLVRVTTALEQGADLGLACDLFERGLRSLVQVSDVQIRDAVPAVPVDGSESVCFTIPTGGAPAMLQATFPRHYEPAEEEFRLLKAAATMAGLVIQFAQAVRASAANGGNEHPVEWALPG